MDLNNIVNFDTSGAIVFSVAIVIIAAIAIASIAFRDKHKSK